MLKILDKLFELIYVDKYYKKVPIDSKQLGTWQFKHRYLATIILTILLPLWLVGILTLGIIIAPIKFITDVLGLTDRYG